MGLSIIGDPSGMIAFSRSLDAGAQDYLVALESQASNLAAPTINPNFPTVGAAPTPVTK